MAYYTVAHLLQNNSLVGEGSSVDPKELTDEFWDYVFSKDVKSPPKDCKLSPELTRKFKNEFNYWYPLDLRVSGKDLVPNHLTYAIFNHCLIWQGEPDKWIQSIRANGHLLLNNEKMSKSTGNFLTLEEAIKKYSSDGVRLALADSGDGVDDANFLEKSADLGLLKLFNLLEWSKEMINDLGSLRDSNVNNSGDNVDDPDAYSYYADKLFKSQMERLKAIGLERYDKMMFKEALKNVFFEYQDARDKYRELCTNKENMSRQLIKEFIRTQAIILAPICPHLGEIIFGLLNEKESVFKLSNGWPMGKRDSELEKQYDYFFTACHVFRVRKDAFDIVQRKAGKNIKEKTIRADIYIANGFPEWQQLVLDAIKKLYEETGKKEYPDSKTLSKHLAKIDQLKKYMKKVMPFAETRRKLFAEQGELAFDKNLKMIDEKQVLEQMIDYLKYTLNVEKINLRWANESQDERIRDTCPLEPLINYEID